MAFARALREAVLVSRGEACRHEGVSGAPTWELGADWGRWRKVLGLGVEMAVEGFGKRR